MAQLVAQGGHRKELQKDLNLIGSEHSADIAVLPSWGVAPHHYRIGRSSAGWLVEPLAGADNTLINGAPIGAITLLRHGDQIAAGQLVLTFVDPVAAATPTPSQAAIQIEPRSPRQRKLAVPKLPRVALFGALGIILLAGGALAAWKFGAFDSGNVATPESLGSGAGGVVLPASDHFGLLAQFAPANPALVASFDLEGIAAFYDRFEATADGVLPGLDSIREQALRKAGFDPLTIEHVSFVSASIGRPLFSAETIPDDFIAVVSFRDGDGLRALLKAMASDTAKVDAPPGVHLHAFQGGSSVPAGLGMRPVSERHLLIGSPSRLSHTPRPRAAPRIEELRHSTATIYFSAVPGEGSAAIAEPLLSAGPRPQRFDLGFDLKMGAKLSSSLQFSDARSAALSAANIDTNLKRLTDERNAAASKTVQVSPRVEVYGLLDGLLERRLEDKQFHLTFSIDDAELKALGSKIRSEVSAETMANSATVDAQQLSGVCATAIAAETKAFDEVSTARAAATLLIQGVKGGGNFSDTEFRAAGIPPERLEAALEYLSWDTEKQLLLFEDKQRAPSPAANLVKSLYAFLYPDPASPAGQSQNSARAKRNAQTLVSLQNSVLATGSEAFKGVKGAKGVIHLLVAGVAGGPGFETTLFQLPDLTSQDIQAALQFLNWDKDTQMLQYVAP